MKLVPSIQPGQTIGSGFFTRLANAVNFLSNVSVGPGLALHIGAGGWGIALAPQKRQRSGGGEAEECTGGTLLELTEDVGGTGCTINYVAADGAILTGPGLTVGNSGGTGYAVGQILRVISGVGDGGKVAVASLVGSTTEVATITLLTAGTGYVTADNAPTTCGSWIREEDDCPVSVTFALKPKYDLTTHILSYRMRTLYFDRCGKLTIVTTRSAETTITTAEPC